MTLSQSDRAFLVVGFVVVTVLLVFSLSRPAAPTIINHYAWRQDQPPEGEPIMGMWVEKGLPSPAVCVRVGSWYLEYAPGSASEVLHETDPIWWIGMPGGAE